MHMQEAQNTKLVQEAYAAFLEGDVAAVLARLDEQVDWKPVIGAGKHVPMSGARRGIARVGEFFEQVAANVTFTTFDPQHYVAQGDKVVALGHYTATMSGGGSFDSDFAMIFTVRNGKITAFQEFLDSAALNASFPATMKVGA
jgi:ketosteroid isomerase-like protein